MISWSQVLFLALLWFLATFRTSSASQADGPTDRLASNLSYPVAVLVGKIIETEDALSGGDAA